MEGEEIYGKVGGMLEGVPSFAFRTTSSIEASIVHELSELEVPPERGRGVDPDLVKLLEEVEAFGVVHSEPEILLGLVKVSTSDSDPEENSKGSGSRSAQGVRSQHRWNHRWFCLSPKPFSAAFPGSVSRFPGESVLASRG